MSIARAWTKRQGKRGEWIVPFAHGTTEITATVSSAITNGNLATAGSNTDATSYATASVTHTANRLQLFFITTRVASGDPNIPTVTGATRTWDQIATVVNAGLRITAFRAMKSSTDSGALTADFAGQTQTMAQWSLLEYTGVEQNGMLDNGLSTILNVQTNSSPSASGLTVTVNARESDGSAVVCGLANASNTAVGPNAGWAELSDGGVSNGIRIETQNDLSSPGTDPGGTGATAAWGGIAFEIRRNSGWVNVGLPFLYTTAEFSGVSLYLEGYLRTVGGSTDFCNMQLVRVSDSTPVVSSEISNNTTSLVRKRSAALTLVDGTVYRVQAGTRADANGAYLGARMIAA